jgi:serine/threonine-protein kinase RsbW
VSVDVVTLAIPARTEYLILARLALAGIAREVEIDQAMLADLKLAVTEACGNAVQHAQPGDAGMVTVRYMVSDDAIEIRVEDDGPGMDEAPASVMPEGELSESGMGLAIIHALVDRLEIGPGVDGRGTTVRMRRLRSAGASA